VHGGEEVGNRHARARGLRVDGEQRGEMRVGVDAVGRDVPGYASLMVVVLFGFAVQMIAFGVLGEYIGRLYEEVKGRPLYLIRERVGFEA